MGVCPAYLGMSQRKSELGWLWLLRAAMLKIRGVDYCVQQVASHDYTTLRASFPTASLQGRVDAVAQCRGVERLSKKADSTRCHGPLTHLGGRKCRHENDWKKVSLRGQSALQ